MRNDGALNHFLDERYQRVYDPMFDEMVTIEEWRRRLEDRRRLTKYFDLGRTNEALHD